MTDCFSKPGAYVTHNATWGLGKGDHKQQMLNYTMRKQLPCCGTQELTACWVTIQ